MYFNLIENKSCCFTCRQISVLSTLAERQSVLFSRASGCIQVFHSVCSCPHLVHLVSNHLCLCTRGVSERGRGSDVLVPGAAAHLSTAMFVYHWPCVKSVTLQRSVEFALRRSGCNTTYPCVAWIKSKVLLPNVLLSMATNSDELLTTAVKFLVNLFMTIFLWMLHVAVFCWWFARNIGIIFSRRREWREVGIWNFIDWVSQQKKPPKGWKRPAVLSC